MRFGLRAPDDPRILNTVKVIDALLKVNLPQGPCWYRYNGDGYGEHEDGSPFDGTGIGRPWPLLAGERAHYELAAGRPQAAEDLLKVMELSTEGGRLIPEQVWDAADIPALELFRGKPSGSACPLVWAHSEYVKLRRSLRDGKIFDQPPQTVQRYQVEKQESRLTSNGASTTNAAPCRRERSCACCCPRRPWCTGASMAGKPRRTRTRATRWESSSQTCPPTSSRQDAKSCSRSTGRRSSAGKGRTTR